jgi:metal-responsive CopG/Arc/MetJ family transcriptional regulator
MASAAMGTKRVIVEFPHDLFAQTEMVVRELEISRSSLIRSAVENYLKQLNQQRLERDLAEGYAANAVLDRQICTDFSHVDAESL